MVRCSSLAAAAASTLLVISAQSASAGSFTQTNLSSDIPGLGVNTDANLKNPWGMSFAPTSPVWIANQGTNNITLHTGDGGQAGLVVSTTGGPTGTVFNTTNSLTIGPASPATFLFSTLDGQIKGWNGAQGTTASTMASSFASYTGLAIGSFNSLPALYAPDFAHGKIDVYTANAGGGISLTSSGFVDPNLPAGYSPFNIQNINNKLYVEYATPSAPINPDHGIVDIFDTTGNLLQRLISNTHLNSPWGVTLAPAGFGQLGGDLLVGNNGDGTISVFDPVTGAFIETLRDKNGNPLVNPGLWALIFRTGGTGFDPNTLYFTAGINDQADGLFGEIQADGVVAANTPLPTALPLFASGLGFAGVIAWRRKRKH